MLAERLFRDRQDAGAALAGLLDRYRNQPDVVVLGLPRGGVPVASEVAVALGAPLDVFVVRRLGVPGSAEIAMGAIASGGVVVLNDDIVRDLRIPPEQIQQAAEREGRELARSERAYREGRPMPDLTGRTVLLVDDGLATGAVLRAAVQAVGQLQPGRLVVAVPAAPESTCRDLLFGADEVVCATTPASFSTVGESYWDAAPVTDEDVRDILRAAAAATVVPVEDRVPTAEAVIRVEAQPVSEGVPNEDALFDLVGDARFVLIGDGTHGTHEFYAARAAMTRRLIAERGFCAVALEADWPDTYRVNRFVRGQGDDRTAEESLRGFQRFPTWMWRNTPMLDFVGWLREHNERTGGPAGRGVGVYGLDLYSLYRSMSDVVAYLDRVDPAAAARARRRYACFDHFRDAEDGQAYGFAAADGSVSGSTFGATVGAAFGAGETCEDEVVEQLVEFQRQAAASMREDGTRGDERFSAEQNARSVVAAAEYYRSTFAASVSPWNLRDRHMADTLDALSRELSRERGEPARIVVWAHNSHVGDAGPTEFALRQEASLGQLVRERHPGQSRLIGLTTYTGTVTAAEDWGGPAERMRVRPALPDSVEELFHETGAKDLFLPFRTSPRSTDVLRSARLERAIGLIYRPQTERDSHYFRARLADQFDAVIHIDDTRAVEPVERAAAWDEGDVPETYPFGV
jgi:erythromycin esterase-like protein/predicted phosphoribosyltransferase